MHIKHPNLRTQRHFKERASVLNACCPVLLCIEHHKILFRGKAEINNGSRVFHLNSASRTLITDSRLEELFALAMIWQYKFVSARSVPVLRRWILPTCHQRHRYVSADTVCFSACLTHNSGSEWCIKTLSAAVPFFVNSCRLEKSMKNCSHKILLFIHAHTHIITVEMQLQRVCFATIYRLKLKSWKFWAAEQYPFNTQHSRDVPKPLALIQRCHERLCA
jgi:hypothetical protein